MYTKADEEAVKNWLQDQGIIQRTNPHEAQRYVPHHLDPLDLEKMPKRIIDCVINLATYSKEDDPSIVLSEILEQKRKVILRLRLEI